MVPFLDLKFWLLTFMLITAYSSISVLLSASAPVRTWLYGSGRTADMLSERETIVKNLLMICASVLILVLAQFNNLIVLTPLTALVYWTGKKLVTLPKERAFRFCLPVIIFLVVFLGYYKYLNMQLLLNRAIGDIVSLQRREKVLILVGVSYFSFKFIHFLIECYNKRVNNLDFLTFLNYILFFPSFFAGPVNRYNQFSQDIYNSSVSIDHAGGIRRIIEGLFKKVVLCSFLLPYSLTSIKSNIAEGFERGGRGEFHQFLSTAKASCAEVRSQQYVALHAGYLDKAAFDQLIRQAEEVARIAGGLRSSVRRQKADRGD